MEEMELIIIYDHKRPNWPVKERTSKTKASTLNFQPSTLNSSHDHHENPRSILFLQIHKKSCHLWLTKFIIFGNLQPLIF
jgi:hypothetical protein